MLVSPFPISLPITSFYEADFRPVRLQSAGKTGGIRDYVIDRALPQWKATLKSRKLFATTNNEIGLMRAFFDSLRGSSRFFLLGDPFRPFPASYMPKGLATAGYPTTRALGGAWDGNAVLSAVGNSGLSGVGRDLLSLTGLPNGYQLNAGDYIGLWQGADLLTQPNAFDNAAWTKSANLSVTANATTAPDGTTTAEKLFENTTTAGVHSATQSASGLTAGPVYGLIDVKADVRTQAFLQLGDGTTSPLTVGDLSALTVSAPVGSSWSGLAASIIPLSSTWRRILLTGTPGGAAISMAVGPASGGNSSYAGVNTDGAFFWDGELWQWGGITRSLHRILNAAQVAADSSGNAQLWVEPEIPASFNPWVTMASLHNPVGKFRLVSSDMPIDAAGRNRPAQASFTATSTLL